MAQSWFIMRGESRLGPFTHHGLVSLAANGGLSQDDMVWCSDLPAPMAAVGVAGLFPEPEPEPVPEPSYRPPPRQSPSPYSDVGFSVSATKRDRFAALFEDDGDAAVEEEAEDHDQDHGPVVPVVRRTPRRVVPARRKADNSGLLIGLGGISLLAVIMLIVVLEQGGSPPNRGTPSTRPAAGPVVRTSPPPTAPPSVARPEPTPQPTPAPPPPPPPRFDKQPLIDEMSKAAVDAIYQANTSVKARYRELWESQLQTLLTQETKGMREEQEIRAVVKRVCDAWAEETRKFVAAEAAPPPDAIDGAAGAQADPDAPMEADAPPGEPEPELGAEPK